MTTATSTSAPASALLVETRTAHIEVLTTGSSGPDIVFLHGVLGLEPDSAFLGALGARARVFAPLLPGYSAAPDAPHVRTMLDFTLLMLDVVEALHVNDPIIVGHCMGGMIAAEMAALAPNEVRRLALIAPLGLWLDDHQILDVFAMAPSEIADAWYFDSAGHDLPDLADPVHLESVLIRNARQLATAGKLLFPIPDRGLSARLPRVKAASLLVWGADDRYVPQVYAGAFRDLLRQSETVVIPNAGHMVIEEEPEAVARAIAGLFDPISTAGVIA